MRSRALLPVVVLAAAFAGPAASQEGKDVVVFEAGDRGVELMKFLDFLSETTGQRFVYDPNSPQIRGKKIGLRGDVEIPAEKVFAWGRSLLFFQRVVLVPNGPRETKQWLVLDTNSPAVCSHPEYVPCEELSKWEEQDGAYIVTTIPVRHLADTSKARNALAQLSTRQVGRVNDIPGSRAFVVGDFAPVVCSMAKLLAQMDVASEDVARRVAKENVALAKQLDKYEQMLMNARTETAAKYFEKQVNLVRTKMEAAN